MTVASALAADRAGDLPRAAALYESAIAEGQVSIEVLLNLALLYWQATDPGLAGASGMDPDFYALAGRRVFELLELAGRTFPSSASVRFWQKYIAWSELGEKSPDPEECWALLREDPETLIPAMHIYAASNGEEARSEASLLRKECRESGTTGARYVVSLIEGVMARRGET